MPPPYQRRRRVGCICAGAIFTRASDLHCSLSVTHTCTDAGSSTANSGATEDRSGYIDVIEVVEEEEVVVVEEEEEEDWIVAEGTASESHSSHSLASLLRLLDEPSTAASPSLRCSINSGFQ